MEELAKKIHQLKREVIDCTQIILVEMLVFTLVLFFLFIYNMNKINDTLKGLEEDLHVLITFETQVR